MLAPIKHQAWYFCLSVSNSVVSDSCVQFFVTPWNVAHQVSLSMEFSRQEYWRGLLCPLPGDLPNPGIEPGSLTPPAVARGFFTNSTTWQVLLEGGGLTWRTGSVGTSSIQTFSTPYFILIWILYFFPFKFPFLFFPFL